MKKVFTLEIVNGQYVIVDEVRRVHKKLGNITQAEAWLEFENFKRNYSI